MNPGLLPAIDGFQPFARRNLVANVVAKNRNGGVTLLSKVLLAVAEDYVSHMADYQWVTIDFELATPYWWDDSATIRNVSAVPPTGGTSWGSARYDGTLQQTLTVGQSYCVKHC